VLSQAIFKPVTLCRKQSDMQQPELGRRLTALRKEKGLTQEELVEKSHVSVRTIQRIEAGEVLPRTITIKILLEALGESYESFSNQPTNDMEAQHIKAQPNQQRNTLLTAVLSGSIYLIAEIILGAMDIAWMTDGRNWAFPMTAIYTGLTVVMVISFALFARGFVALASIFENTLLKVAAYLLMAAMLGHGILDVSTLSAESIESVWMPYAVFAVIMGAIGIVFGISLLRLQDSMGELSRVAGILEIIMGCLLVTVVLFFLSYIILIPATVLEILVLYRGYEYLSKTEGVAVS
jgi:transcriptional regulator with XRE-family HTH domain